MNEVPSAIAHTASTTYAITKSLVLLCIERMPSKMENPAPAMKMPNAASSDQKYRSCPYPNGCSSSAGRMPSRSEVNRKTWLRVSANEWAASASMALEPVRIPATSLAIMTMMLAPPAISTVRVVDSRDSACRCVRVCPALDVTNCLPGARCQSSGPSCPGPVRLNRQRSPAGFPCRSAGWASWDPAAGLRAGSASVLQGVADRLHPDQPVGEHERVDAVVRVCRAGIRGPFQEQHVTLVDLRRSEEHTSELQ